MKQVHKPFVRPSVTKFFSMAALLGSFSCAPDQILPPNQCNMPPLTQNEREVDRIFGFDSMHAVAERFGTCTQRATVASLIDSYSHCQRLDQIDAAFNQVFDQRSTPSEERADLVNAAHSLYVEINRLVPWSLEDYSRSEIEFLIPTKSRDERLYPRNMFPSHSQNVEEVESYRVLPVALSLRRGHQLESARQVTQWIAINFFHPYANDTESYRAFDCSELYGPSDYGPGSVTTCQLGASYLKTDSLFRERNLTAGCHTAASLGATILRSINIPAAEVDFGAQRSARDAGHGILYLPSLGLYSHGDWLSVAAGRAGEYFLYPYNRFMETTLDMWNSSGWGINPVGERDALFTVSLHRRANTRTLYVHGVFDIYEFPQPANGVLSPITGFRNDLRMPLPQLVRMLEILRVYEPRFQYVVGDPRRAELVSRDIPIATLEELRQDACR